MANSQYLEQAWLNQWRGTLYTIPGTTYLGLSTTPITTGPGGTTGITEPSGNNYARVAVTSTTGNWGAAGGGFPASIANASSFNFPTPSGSGWGTIVNWFFSDAATGGNILDFGPLALAQSDPFSGNGTQTVFTSSAAPVGDPTYDAVAVTVGGVAKAIFTDYGLTWNAAGTVTVTFNTAPISGSNNVVLDYQKAVSQAVPANAAVAFGAGQLTVSLY